MEDITQYLLKTWNSIQEGWQDKEADAFEEVCIKSFSVSLAQISAICDDIDAVLSSVQNQLDDM